MSHPRHDWPIRIFPLDQEPSGDLSATTTIEERLALVTMLSGARVEAHGEALSSIFPLHDAGTGHPTA